MDISEWSPKDNTEQEFVWVDGKTLQSFLRQPFMPEDAIASPDAASLSSTLQRAHSNLICEHGIGLRPSIARRGKWLKREVYDSLNHLPSSDEENNVKNSEPITMAYKFRCDVCSNEYSSALQEKAELLKKLIEADELLNPSFKDDNFDSGKVRMPNSFQRMCPMLSS